MLACENSFVDGLFIGSEYPTRTLAMIYAYLDESGSHDKSKIFALAGYYGELEEWETFGRHWKCALEQAGLKGVPFHAADFEGGYDIFKDWSVARKIDLMEKLINVIDRRDLHGVAGAIVMREYKEAVTGESEFLEEKWAPYIVCQQLCYQKILKKTATDVAFVHDRQEEYDYPAQQWFFEYKDAHPEHADRMKSVTFSSKKDYLPLQAADLLAYETAKGLHNRLYDSERPHRKSMLALARKKRLDGGFFDKNGSKFLVDLAEYGQLP